MTALHTDGCSGSASSARQEIRSRTTKRVLKRYQPLPRLSPSGPSGRTSTRPRLSSPRRTTSSSIRASVAPCGRTHLTSQVVSGSCAFARASQIVSGRNLSSLSLATSSLVSHRRTRTSGPSYAGARLACVKARTFLVFGIALMNPSYASVSGASGQAASYFYLVR